MLNTFFVILFSLLFAYKFRGDSNQTWKQNEPLELIIFNYYIIIIELEIRIGNITSYSQLLSRLVW